MNSLGLYSVILIVVILAPTVVPHLWWPRQDTGRWCRRGEVYLPRSGGCYAVGTKCTGHLMKVYNIGNGFGACQCMKPRGYAQPLVYWQRTNDCYPIYMKGPCPRGQVLIQNWEDSYYGECGTGGYHGAGDDDGIGTGDGTGDDTPSTTSLEEQYE